MQVRIYCLRMVRMRRYDACGKTVHARTHCHCLVRMRARAREGGEKDLGRESLWKDETQVNEKCEIETRYAWVLGGGGGVGGD